MIKFIIGLYVFAVIAIAILIAFLGLKDVLTKMIIDSQCMDLVVLVDPDDSTTTMSTLRQEFDSLVNDINESVATTEIIPDFSIDEEGDVSFNLVAPSQTRCIVGNNLISLLNEYALMPIIPMNIDDGSIDFSHYKYLGGHCKYSIIVEKIRNVNTEGYKIKGTPAVMGQKLCSYLKNVGSLFRILMSFASVVVKEHFAKDSEAATEVNISKVILQQRSLRNQRLISYT